jgi:hypothetical protein
MESKVYGGASRRGTGLTSMMTHNKKTPAKLERWSLNQAVPPLAIANRHYNTNNQLVQNTRYRLILAKASNFDWLTRDRHAMRDLTAVAKEGSHHWVPIQDLPFDEIILFAYAADHSSRPTYVCLPSGLYHERSGRILQQSGPNQEVMPTWHLLLRWMESTTQHGHSDRSASDAGSTRA